MTKKRFWDDPYLTQHQTTVATCDGAILTLAETILYAETGGQESDTGTIANYPVLQARKDGREIFYTLPADHTLQVGDSVDLQLDWPRRYRLMRLHFATEIVLELVYQRIPGIEKIGAHIAEDKARVDFDWPENFNTFLAEIHEQAKALIEQDHSIISAFSDIENERRYWKIKGFAQVSCGGTHPKSTGEVGEIRLKRKNVGQNKERIEIKLVQT